MKKAERLLDLITFMLNTTQPVSFEEIQNAFSEDYAEGKEDAIARKFERDKADILDLGLPLKFVVGDEDEKGCYIIDRQKYSLPQINLEPAELVVLCLASTAALDLGDSPFTQDLTLALNKIGFATGDRAHGGFSSLRVCSSDRLGEVIAARRQETLNSIRVAINHHKTVILFYHSLWRDQKNKRKVNPYGLVCRRGGLGRRLTGRLRHLTQRCLRARRVCFRPGLVWFRTGLVWFRPGPVLPPAASAGAHAHTVAVGAHTHTVAVGAHTHSVVMGSHTHTITVAAAGNAENTVKNIAYNYIVRLA